MKLKCKIENCTGLLFLTKQGIRRTVKGYCAAHYAQLRRHNTIKERPIVNLGSRKGKKQERHPHYFRYRDMLRRCYDTSNRDYERYGGRGIAVCEEWLGDNGFANFCRDIGARPFETASIDRIDNDKGYYLENVRWADHKTQTMNRSISLRKEAERQYILKTAD